MTYKRLEDLRHNLFMTNQLDGSSSILMKELINDVKSLEEKQTSSQLSDKVSKTELFELWSIAFYDGYHVKGDEAKDIPSRGRCLLLFNEWYEKIKSNG